MGVGQLHPRRKVCVLTSVHSPYDVRIFHKEAKALATAGYEVTIIAPHSSSEHTEGIRVRAVSLPDSRRERMLRTIPEIYRAAKQTGAEVFHFHDPELIPIGILLKLRGKRVVYDVHEDVPQDILDKDWIAPALRWAIAKVTGLTETFGARLFDGIVAATSTIAGRFPRRKTVTIQNFPQVDTLAPTNGLRYSERAHTSIYAGGINAFRGAREMVQAMSLLPESLNARLVFAGHFEPPELRGELQSLPGASLVEFLGWVSPECLRALLGKSRVGLVLYHPLANHTKSQPNKMFEYMSAGIPLVASDFSLWRQIVRRVDCGIVVNPRDPAAIAQAIEWLLVHPRQAEAMGRRGRQAVETLYNWRSQSQILVEWYQQLIP